MADLDLQFLLGHLSEIRGTHYKLIERPDEQQRQTPAPDYLIQEQPTGKVIAIEYTQLMQEDLQRATARALKAGAGMVMYGPVRIDPQKIASALMVAIKRKLARGQLQNTEADERILLVYNRIMGTERTYQRANPRFTSNDTAGIDHTFLIADRRLFQVW